MDSACIRYLANNRKLWRLGAFFFSCVGMLSILEPWYSQNSTTGKNIYDIGIGLVFLAFSGLQWRMADRVYLCLAPDFLEINAIGVKHKIFWQDIIAFGPVKAGGINSPTCLTLKEPVAIHPSFAARLLNRGLIAGNVVDLSQFLANPDQSELKNLILRNISDIG